MTERKKYKQREIPGSVVQIDLADGTFAYGQVLEIADTVFFDYLTRDETSYDLQAIVTSPVLFKISVMKYAITQDWKIIGKCPLDPAINRSEDVYIIDSLTGKVYIWKVEGGRMPSTWEECKHLECFAAWEPQGVEQRLRDHFAGRPCWGIESKKPGWKFIPITEFYKQYGYDYKIEWEQET